MTKWSNRPGFIAMGLTGRAKIKRVDELLTQIELEPLQYRDRLTFELSGGQKQRVGISRALSAEPKFIICDEVASTLNQLVATIFSDYLLICKIRLA